ncbi:MAG: hypothetical protein U0992_22205 [Planctomycetaceae bacterium]
MQTRTTERIPPSVRHGLTLALGTGAAVVLVVVLARCAAGAFQATPAPWLAGLLSAVFFGASMTVWRLDDMDSAAANWQPRVARATVAWLTGLLFGLLIARDNAPALAAVVAVGLVWAAVATVRIWQSLETLGAVSEPGGRSRPVGKADAIGTPPVHCGSSGASQSRDAETGELNLSSMRAVPLGTESAVTNPHLPADDPSLRLRFQRHVTTDGETIDIVARLEFADGAREAVLHVPFWPALSAIPEVECEPLADDDVDLRVTAAERHGLRIEGRLAAATDGVRSILIGIEVHAAGPGAIAAAA